MLLTPGSIPHGGRRKEPFSSLIPLLFAGTAWSCDKTTASKEKNPSQRLNLSVPLTTSLTQYLITKHGEAVSRAQGEPEASREFELQKVTAA